MTFKSAEARSVGASATQLAVNGAPYSVATGVVNILVGLNVANTDPANAIAVDAYVLRNGAPIYLVRNMTLPVGSAEGLADEKTVLLPGDAVYVRSSIASSLDAVLSILETI
jgi:hypothetical protein